MTRDQVTILAGEGTFNKRRLRGKVIETHISWVILSGDSAFKIKKPLKLEFLDFSTPTRRKRMCSQEVILNRRLTDIYQGVLPVRVSQKKYFLGGTKGKIIDFAVHLRRLPQSQQMDNMMKRGTLQAEHVRAVGDMIASFHAKASINRSPFVMSASRNLFNNISSFKAFVQSEIGKEYSTMIDRSVKWSDAFLRRHKKRLQERITEGFKRDVHGDLHSGNIFIYRKPVIFDCIEFNDEFRQIDVLYEIAFLLMDLEVFHEEKLATTLLSTYLQRYNVITTPSDRRILNYYKCLRANVRAKIHLMAAQQMPGTELIVLHLDMARRYLDQMSGYTLPGNRP